MTKNTGPDSKNEGSGASSGSGSRCASISTRKGDEGKTGLLFGQRVSKTHPQIEAVGTCDELTSALGVARAACLVESRRQLILAIQKDLIAMMGEVVCAEEDLARLASGKISGFPESRADWIEREAATIERNQNFVRGWALPGENAESAALELARAVGRRAERAVWRAKESGRVCSPQVYRYLNRLSDLLWLLARQAADVETPGSSAS